MWRVSPGISMGQYLDVGPVTVTTGSSVMLGMSSWQLGFRVSPLDRDVDQEAGQRAVVLCWRLTDGECRNLLIMRQLTTLSPAWRHIRTGPGNRRTNARNSFFK